MSRILFCALALGLWSIPAYAQTYPGDRPRRHFVSVSYGSLYTHPLHFAEHPLSDLTGREVAAAQREAYDYETRDGETRIHVREFGRRQRGAGVTIYPFGMSQGSALMVRGSVEHLPRILLDFDGPAPLAQYSLTDGRAVDGAAGLIVADRSAGWGVGTHTFVLAGAGRITSSLGNGRRVFAEGGGGLGVGPFGVELSVKFAWNTLNEPVDHSFFTVPLTIRGTLTF